MKTDWKYPPGFVKTVMDLCFAESSDSGVAHTVWELGSDGRGYERDALDEGVIPAVEELDDQEDQRLFEVFWTAAQAMEAAATTRLLKASTTKTGLPKTPEEFLRDVEDVLMVRDGAEDASKETATSVAGATKKGGVKEGERKAEDETVLEPAKEDVKKDSKAKGWMRLSSDDMKRKKEIWRLHINWNHPSAWRLWDFAKAMGAPSTDRAIIYHVTENCGICSMTVRHLPRPGISLPRAFGRNAIVALDGFFIRGGQGMGLLMASVGTLRVEIIWLRNKTSELVRDALLEKWEYERGTPQGWLLDPAGEFMGEVFENFCRRFSIDIYCVPTEAQWGNPAERYIGAAKSWIIRFLEANEHVAMSRACAAAGYGLNNLSMSTGFSPMQRMQGGDLRLPHLMSSNLAGLLPGNAGWPETAQSSMESQLGLMRKAQTSLLYSDGDKRILAALHEKPRSRKGNLFLEEEVEAWRDGEGWSIRGRVAGVVGSDVAILVGRNLVHSRISRVRAQKPRINPVKIPLDGPERKQQVLEWLRSKNPAVDDEGNPRLYPKRKENDDGGFADEDENIIPGPFGAPRGGAGDGPFGSDSGDSVFDAEDGDEHREQILEVLDQGGVNSHDGIPSAPNELGDVVMDDEAVETQRHQAIEQAEVPVLDEEEAATEVPVLSELDVRLVAAIGTRQVWTHKNVTLLSEVMKHEKKPWVKHKSWDAGVREMNAFLSALEEEVKHPASYASQRQLRGKVVPPRMALGPEWDEARARELQSWFDFDAVEVVSMKDPEYGNCVIMPHLFVYTRKDSGLAKARLCIRGDVERIQHGIDTEALDAPTADRMTTRMLHAITVEMGWEEFFGDVPTAFLQGDRQERDRIILIRGTAFMCLKDDEVLRCKVNCYGANDAPVAWYRSFRRWCEGKKFVPLSMEPCLFVFHDEDGSWSATLCFTWTVFVQQGPRGSIVKFCSQW